MVQGVIEGWVAVGGAVIGAAQWMRTLFDWLFCKNASLARIRLRERKGSTVVKGSTMGGSGGGSLLQDIPDDVLAVISASMHFRDLLNLSFTCKKFRLICDSDKLWMPHCLGIVAVNLPEWRKVMPSWKALFRFLISVKSLVGIWVHQNPELGNMVYVTWGFVSVVACRIIPQEMGPNGLDMGLLWAPVFEIVGNEDGSLAFFLHGREGDRDYFYPGRFKCGKEEPNVLLLEAEPLLSHNELLPTTTKSATIMDKNEDYFAGEDVKVVAKSHGFKGKKKVLTTNPLQFHQLAFGDRRRLLEVLAPQVRVKVPQSARGPLFPSMYQKLSRSSYERSHSATFSNESYNKEFSLLAARRFMMLSMYTSSAKAGFCSKGVESANLVTSMCSSVECKELGKTTPAVNSKPLALAASSQNAPPTNDLSATASQVSTGKSQSDSAKRSGFAQFVRTKMKQIIGKSSSQDPGRTSLPSSSEAKRLQLQEFLRQGQAVGLRLQATSWRLNFYRAWPIMHDNRFALYKVPEQKPVQGREHAGLWGGTFGWPPGVLAPDKAGTPLYFLLLSYDETEEGCLLIATKILEGTHNVLHPNGSAMFTAKMNEPSNEQFPFDGGALDIVQSYQGEGIANGYGFRYPGSKPGDLFVYGNGILAFVWRESRSVLALQRMDLKSLLEKGDRVAALPPIFNFAYLTKSYSNVFTGYCGPVPTTAGLSHEPRK